MTHEEIRALAEQHARNAGYTPESREWWVKVMTFEIQIEIDLELLSLMAGPVYVPPLPGAVDFHAKKKRRYWKKVKFVICDNELRRVEKLVDGQWVQVRMLELKDGDVFRLFEPNGEPVVDGKDVSEWQVEGDAYVNDMGIATVKVADGS
jgi:hypothetical protein